MKTQGTLKSNIGLDNFGMKNKIGVSSLKIMDGEDLSKKLAFFFFYNFFLLINQVRVLILYLYNCIFLKKSFPNLKCLFSLTENFINIFTLINNILIFCFSLAFGDRKRIQTLQQKEWIEQQMREKEAKKNNEKNQKE